MIAAAVMLLSACGDGGAPAESGAETTENAAGKRYGNGRNGGCAELRRLLGNRQ